MSVRGCRLTRLHNERCAGAPPWPCRFTTTNHAWETQGQLVGRNEENAANNQTNTAVDDTVTHTEMRDGVGRLCLLAGDWVFL